MTDYTTWAESLCDPAASRPLLLRPHALAGTAWGFTTDGHFALFLSVSAWNRPLDVHDDHGKLVAMLAPPNWYVSTLGAVLAWAGEPNPRRCDCDGEPVKCMECDGFGQHGCDCGDRHECGDCVGSGYVTCKECANGLLPPHTRPAPLLVGGPILDRNLLHKLLVGCPDPPETKIELGWGGESDPVVLRAAGWTGLVMPTLESSLFDEVPLVPPDWDNPLGGPHYDEDAFGRPVYDPPGERSA